MTEVARRRLSDVRRVLLRLHKALLDAEREDYESVHGQVSGAELLQLVINPEQFAWLRPVSELIVRIDKVQDEVEPVTAEEAESLLAGARAPVKPSETGGGFRQRYCAAIQREPEVVLAHRDGHAPSVRAPHLATFKASLRQTQRARHVGKRMGLTECWRVHQDIR